MTSYNADIRWTTHGVAHIKADDWGGLGYGQGYACARDHLDTLADQFLKVRSERALFHGPGPEDGHIASDFGYLAMGVTKRAPSLRDAQPPHITEMIAGYVAGYNAWVAESGATDPWVRPITELDYYAYLFDVALMASGRNLAGVVGRAEAPGPDGPVPPSPISALGASGASNGWAMGGDATASGHSIVLANPHFPWDGEARFWECHLTIPGELDVYGVSLLGTPGVQMGFNQNVAWAHTFSAGFRFTFYQLKLVADHPTQYHYGEEIREMSGADYSVDVLQPDGSVASVSRTLWSSHYGPMINLPLLGWGLELGFTYRDANQENDRVMSQFLGMDQAADLDDFQRIYHDVQGLPWVNTLAGDRSGRVWYTDGSATPNISAKAQQQFTERVKNDMIAALLYENRVAVLDGSDPEEEWQDADGSPWTGMIPAADLPELERRDYVLNANDPHWLANDAEPIEGYSVLHGFERQPQSLRTRQNLRQARDLADRGGVTRQDLIDAVFANHSGSADLLLDEVVERCQVVGSVSVGGEIIDLSEAAKVLSAWDRSVGLEAVGAILWREFMANFSAAERRDGPALWATQFDPNDPVNTPCGLAPMTAGDPSTDRIALAVGEAVVYLEKAGVAIDAPVGQVQWAMRGSERVPVHGGGEGEGMLNVLSPIGALASSSLAWVAPAPPRVPVRGDITGLAKGGYQCTYGTSFVMVVELTDDGPVGQGLLAYGQSGDPESPHHLDGTVAYANAALRPLLFTDAAIDADPNLIRQTVSFGESDPA